MKLRTAKAKEAELLELGKKLQQFYESGYINKKQTILYSFYKGLASGFGAFLGGSIVAALLLWVLSFFHQLPFVHQIVDAFRRTVGQ